MRSFFIDIIKRSLGHQQLLSQKSGVVWRNAVILPVPITNLKENLPKHRDKNLATANKLKNKLEIPKEKIYR
jgi:hypothetical protein